MVLEDVPRPKAAYFQFLEAAVCIATVMIPKRLHKEAIDVGGSLQRFASIGIDYYQKVIANPIPYTLEN